MKRIVSVMLGLGLAVAACGTADSPTAGSDAEPTAAPTTAEVRAADAAPTTTAVGATTTTAAATAAPSTATSTTTAAADATPTTTTPSTATPATTAPTAAAPTTTAAADSQTGGDGQASEGEAGSASDSASEAADPLSAAIEQWRYLTGAPGVVLSVARGDGQPVAFAWGVSDIATDSPMTVDHHVRIGSVTKPVTAAVILQLAAEGKLELDAPVATYLGDDWAPGYVHAEAVTVRDLLGHTSGFVEYAFDTRFYQLAASRLDEQISPEEILAFASEYGPVSELGTEYHYNTTGYVAAGLLIESVTGNTAAAELRSRIFEPLGLENIYLTPQEFPPEPTANGYVGGTLGYLMAPLLGLSTDNQIAYGDAIFVDIGTVPSEFGRSAGWTGGGLEAQIGDVAQLMRGLFAGDILSPEQIAEMTTGHPDAANSYGLGISTDSILGLTVYAHGGGVPGFRTIAAYVPTLDLGVALTTNLLGLDADDDVDTLLELIGPLLASVF